MKSIIPNFKWLRGLGLGCLFALLALPAGQGQTPVCVSFDMPVVSGNVNDIISLPFRANGINQMNTLSLDLNWAASALQFQSLQFGSNPLGLSNANFNPNITGSLKFTWFDPNVFGASLADSTVLFTLELKVLNSSPGFYPVWMNESNWFNSIALEPVGNHSFAYKKGGVYINAPIPAGLEATGFCTKNTGSCNEASGAVSFSVDGGTPPYTFAWSGPGGFASTLQNLESLSDGYYNLSVTDQDGHIVQATVRIVSAQEPLKFTGLVAHTSCAQNDGCINLAITYGQAPFSFAWSTNTTGQNLCGLGPGTYTVTATDANGCMQTDSFTVMAVNSLSVNAVHSNSNCASNQFGTAAALPQNGVSPYRYEWVTGDTTAVIIGLFAGAYTVTVTDMTGCTGTREVYIGDATIYTWGLELIPTCPGPNQPAGNLLLRATEPLNLHYPVTLHWSSGSSAIVQGPPNDTLEVLSFLPSGIYSVMVTDSIGCAQMLETALNCLLDFPADSSIFMWPGDADQNHAVNHHDLLYLGLGYGSVGPARPNATTDWIGQPAPDWPQNTPYRIVNFRHLDTNGDGAISSTDTLAIVNNWGQVVDPSMDDPFGIPKSVPGMATTPAPALSFSADTLLVGQTAPVPVILGSESAPAGNLHGLSFSISYDPNILHPLYFEPLPSWFGDPANGLLCIQRHFPGQHRLDVALTRTDGVPVGGYGIIGRTFIVIEDDIFFRKQKDQPDGLSGGGDGTLTTKLFLRGVQGITPTTRQPEIGSAVTDLVIRQTVNTLGTDHSPVAVKVWPNPVSNVLHIASADAPVLAVHIWDMMGRRVAELPGEAASEISMPVSNWTPGVYTIRVQTAKGSYVKTIICL